MALRGALCPDLLDVLWKFRSKRSRTTSCNRKVQDTCTLHERSGLTADSFDDLKASHIESTCIGIEAEMTECAGVDSEYAAAG